MTNEESVSEDWVTHFDKWYDPRWSKQEAKFFIESLLQRERERTVEQVKSLRGKIYVAYSKKASQLKTEAYDQAIRHIVNLLNKS